MLKPLTMGTALTLALATCFADREATTAGAADPVVVYTALDREFSEPILDAYAKRTGVRVLPKFDVESTKTVGLTNLIIAEAARPRCDLFWNNEILNTLRLKEKGLLAPFHPPHAGDLPETVPGQGRDLVRLRGPGPHPDRQHEARRRGRPAQGDQRPARPEVEGEDRHRQAALRHDGHARRLPVRRLGRREGQGLLPGPEGQRRAGPLGQQAGGHGRRLGADRLRPDRHRRRDGRDRRRAARWRSSIPTASPDELGTLFIPNTLAIIKGAPHRKAAEALADYLLSPEVEAALATGPERPDPAAEEHEGHGAGRDAPDRPRDGGRLRGGGEALGPGRRASSPPSSPAERGGRAADSHHNLQRSRVSPRDSTAGFG